MSCTVHYSVFQQLNDKNPEFQTQTMLILDSSLQNSLSETVWVDLVYRLEVKENMEGESMRGNSACALPTSWGGIKRSSL